MSRINFGIEPWRLTNEHLLAEHREIKRICFVYEKRKTVIKPTQIPKQFTLGTGHVTFFVDKPKYTFLRYLDLHKECLKRGFNVTDYKSSWKVYFTNGLINTISAEITPTKQDINLIQHRISERLCGSKKYYFHYTLNGKSLRIIPETAIDLLTVDSLDNWNK